LSGEWDTRRERIVSLLRESEGPLSVDQISRILELDPKDVLEDLRHIARSLQRSREQLVALPPKCLKCGYVFNLDKPKSPSKCPKCKSEWIAKPLFKVVPR